MPAMAEGGWEPWAVTSALQVTRGRLGFDQLWGSRLFTRERKGCSLWGGGWAIKPLSQAVSCPACPEHGEFCEGGDWTAPGQGGEEKLEHRGLQHERGGWWWATGRRCEWAVPSRELTTSFLEPSSLREVEQCGLHHLERGRGDHGGEGGVGLYHVKEQRVLCGDCTPYVGGADDYISYCTRGNVTWNGDSMYKRAWRPLALSWGLAQLDAPQRPPVLETASPGS